MLSVLRIQNFAIIPECEIEFGPGLNVLSGETGAGKSIILKSIELLTGARATGESIRTGADRCVVEGLMHPAPELLETLRSQNEQLAESLTGDEIVIRRVIDRSGKSKCYINGSLTTAQALQQITASAIDITGQHSQHTLLNPSKHITLLDQFGVAAQQLAEVRELFRAYDRIRKELQLLETNSAERRFYLERLQTERTELEGAKLEAGEREPLEQELSRLGNVESLGSSITTCIDTLSEGEQSVDDSLRSVLVALEASCKLDGSLEEACALVRTAAVELREAQMSLSEYRASLEADPQRLEEIRERIAEIARLERKYRKTPEELLEYLAKIANELDAISGGALDEDKLRETLNELRKKLTAAEQRLTAERKTAAAKLSRLVEQGLAELNMKRAKFGVSIEPCESSLHGADAVSFTLAANPGEPFRPLVKVASGGELSRILLVLKVVLNERTMPSTQIFDEVDAGIGGAVAQVVGEKLSNVAKRSQVILVTHAPQIAAFADNLFRIAKTSSESATTSTVTLLTADQSIDQIAQMLAGKEVSADFTNSARKLIEEARTETKPKRAGRAKNSDDVSAEHNSAAEPAIRKKKRVNE